MGTALCLPLPARGVRYTLRPYAIALPLSGGGSPQHLKRYLAEFDFCYNERAALGVSDEARADRLLGGIVGKRLTYRDSFAA